jgi:hypothetical protein
VYDSSEPHYHTIIRFNQVKVQVLELFKFSLEFKVIGKKDGGGRPSVISSSTLFGLSSST